MEITTTSALDPEKLKELLKAQESHASKTPPSKNGGGESSI